MSENNTRKRKAAVVACIERIAIAREMREARQHGDDLGLSEDETAFYGAPANNKRAVEVIWTTSNWPCF